MSVSLMPKVDTLAIATGLLLRFSACTAHVTSPVNPYTKLTSYAVFLSSRASFDELYCLAERHPGLFQQWDSSGAATHGALTVLFSGDRPDPSFVLRYAGDQRLAAIDGEASHLESGHPPALVPTISQVRCATS